MTELLEAFPILAGFLIVAIAARQIGRAFVAWGLPLISGCLLTGIVAGPHGIGLIGLGASESLRFLDETALAFIAYAAGSELYLGEVREQLRAIKWTTIGLVVATMTLSSTAILLLADRIPFMVEMSASGRFAVALLGGAILVARSPSSAIAVVRELRARGPFTRKALGVTVVLDVVVIIIFATCSSLAASLLGSTGFDIWFVVTLVGELTASFASGALLGMALDRLVATAVDRRLKMAMIVISGYVTFLSSEWLRAVSSRHLGHDVLLEPLLICMVASLWVANRTAQRVEFLELLRDLGPPIFIAFFTLAGASLSLDVLVELWPIALILVVVRLTGIFIGSFVGGVVAGEPMSHNRRAWMCYVTQAGIGLGLAKEVAVEFPPWGEAFATLAISVIVINQLAGPPFFKWAIRAVGEAHPRAEMADFDGQNDALIFGLEGQSLALARLLETHGWKVKVASRRANEIAEVTDSDVDIFPIDGINLDMLGRLNARGADAVVLMLSDDENYELAELIYEHVGTTNVIARLNDRNNLARFHELGVMVVDPSTAMVSLLDHSVRSPSAASLLLGLDDGNDVVEFEIRNRNLHGVQLRDLRLPLDTLVLSVYRAGHLIVSHGYTRLRVGDHVTVVGSTESLDEIELRFGA